MPGVTKEQIERARQVNILDYILTYEPGNVRPVGNGYRLKDHESLAINDGKWYWHSRGFGSKTALDYLTDVRGYGLVDAVCMLLGEKPLEHSANYKAKPPPEKLTFALPLRNKDNKRVIAYLQSRGINKTLILDCIERGDLYESTPYHNAVFTGKDEKGKTRYATMRATTSSYKRDTNGSEKQYGFILPPINPYSHKIAVFESPIDALSHQTLCKEGYIQPFDGWRLSLGGMSMSSVKYFLKNHYEVTHCLICTDKDEAGRIAAAHIKKLSGITTERSPPIMGNDWNDTLQSIKKLERTQNHTRQNDTPYI